MGEGRGSVMKWIKGRVNVRKVKKRPITNDDIGERKLTTGDSFPSVTVNDTFLRDL